MQRLGILLATLAACGGSDGAAPDAAGGDDAPATDGATPDAPSTLGMVTDVRDAACPMGAPPAATCKTVTVRGCPGIETEAIDATLAILVPAGGAMRGTIAHFSGGGGDGFQTSGAMPYSSAGFRQVFVAWASDWEQTASSGIKAAGCRPATLIRWMFDEPTLHAGSRSQAFCGEGFSGGSGQLGYALAHYGAGSVLDYVNELSGPPFARIDLGCDGDAPATATVCGDTVTMRLPPKVAGWENVMAPLTCGSTAVPAAELARWKADSIAGSGGVYAYPQTRVEFFDCTNQATAVTGMAQIYYDEVVAAEGGTTHTAYHCYTQADGCQGEGLGMTGARAAVDAMLAGCIPRH